MQSRRHFFVAIRDGLLADVGGSHHQRVELAAFEEQVMQRRIGEHHAQRRDAWRHLGRNPAPRPARQQHDGPAGSAQRGALFRQQFAEFRNLFQAGGHQRKRLPGAKLALAQPPQSGVIGGVAGQVKAAQALDSEDGAAFQQLPGLVDGLGALGQHALPVPQVPPRGRSRDRR